MNQNLTVGLTTAQRDILLRGLRFVRSSLLLEIQEPTPKAVEERNRHLKDVMTLVDQLSGGQPANSAVTA